MAKRVFLGFLISAKLKKKILLWEEFQKKIFKYRWISARNLHLTLVPPWYTNDPNVIKDKLILLSHLANSIELRFSEVVYAPSSNNPRLIWAEGKTPRQVQELKKYLEILLDKRPESRPFLLHLTLARFNKVDYIKYCSQILDSKIDWQDEVKYLVLFASQLSSKGANYNPIFKINLLAE